MTTKLGPAAGTEQAKQGGKAVKAKYGLEFYAQIGKKGGETVKQQHGPAYYAEIGQRGGQATKRTQDAAYYSRIGKPGGVFPWLRTKAARPPNRAYCEPSHSAVAQPPVYLALAGSLLLAEPRSSGRED